MHVLYSVNYRTNGTNRCGSRIEWFSNRTGTSFEDGRARGVVWTQLPVYSWRPRDELASRSRRHFQCFAVVKRTTSFSKPLSSFPRRKVRIVFLNAWNETLKVFLLFSESTGLPCYEWAWQMRKCFSCIRRTFCVRSQSQTALSVELSFLINSSLRDMGNN